VRGLYRLWAPALALLVAAALILPLVLKGGHKKELLPAAQPAFTKGFQGLLDAARPRGAKRIVVQDCRRGRVGNEHFCAWLGSDSKCRAGFILVTPSGTEPTQLGRVPIESCTTRDVLHWLKAQP
jgi:hypothetical protein